MNEPAIDRFSIRTRPSGIPLMHQCWGKLLFMHWPIDAELLRPLIPSQLEIDTFDGRAWIGVVPFTMWGIRASFLPPIPGTSAFHELNVRTYVHYQGVPGVWFLSLDAANSLAVWGARTFYHLPYFNAEMSLGQEENIITYSSTRTDKQTYAGFFARDKSGFAADFSSDQLRRQRRRADWSASVLACNQRVVNLQSASEDACAPVSAFAASFQSSPRADLNMRWTIGEPLAESTPDSIEFFLTERYCLYAYHRGETSRSRIWHEPWPLRAATVTSCDSTMIESLGIDQPAGKPLLHYAESIAVNIWPLKKVSEARP